MSGPTPAFRHDGEGTAAAIWREDPRWRAVPVLVQGEGPLAVERVVVVGAHPDDETLGAAGLIASAVRAGCSVSLVTVTDGERSHPASPTCTPSELAARRRTELREAARVLGVADAPTMLGLADGAVAAGSDQAPHGLASLLVELVGDGRRTLLVAPWRHDGHSDHEATGRAAAVCAARTGARLLQYPVWAWHWAQPDQMPWDRLVALPLDEHLQTSKRRAVEAHRTQVAPLSAQPGDEVLLGPAVLAHFAGDRETYVREPASDPTLDDLHAERAEPWGAEARWYEERKRDLLVSVLPRRRFRRGLELGCSTGHLARRLAGRCQELIAVDSSAHALAGAAAVVPENVALLCRDLPHGWPEGSFDLVVLSEVGYFLSPAALAQTLARVRTSLTPDGVVVLCHWRHEVAGWPLDGPEVHRRALTSDLPPVLARYEDRDVEMLVLGGPDQAPAPGE